MALINQYSTLQALTGGDLFPVWDIANSDTRKVSLSALTSYILAQVTANISGFTTVYEAPSVSGFTLTKASLATTNTHIIITPTGGFATGTITLPYAATAPDGLMLLVNCTQSITTLTFAPNGASSMTGVPSTLAANGYFTLKYDKPTSTWYRVA